MHSLCPSLQLDELCYIHYGGKKKSTVNNPDSEAVKP